MKTTVEITPEDAQHYLELKYAFRRCDLKGNTEDADVYQSKTYETLLLPKGLSDEDKFATVLIDMFHSGIGLTSRRLVEWFGWTKYKCYKLARSCKYCYTTTLVCEEGGYGGTGWVLIPDMRDAMRKVAAEKYPCRDCAHLSRRNFDPQRARNGHIGYCKLPPSINVTNECGCITGAYEQRKVETEKIFY